MPGSEEGLEDLTNQERFNSEAGAVLVHGGPRCYSSPRSLCW